MLDESTGGTSSETRSASKVLMAVMACLHRSRDEDRPLLLSAAAPSIPESRSGRCLLTGTTESCSWVMAAPTDVVDLTGDSDDESAPAEQERKVPREGPSPKKAKHAPLNPPAEESDDGEMHHPGDLEVDWEGDHWADHDEDCHGPIDTNSNRREYAEGFIWSCCGKLGGSCGCEKGEDPEGGLSDSYPDSEPPSNDDGHPGDLEVDWEGDHWADHDERCHGPIDTNSNRCEYPEGFKWSCCGKLGGSAGCQDVSADE